MTAAQAGPHRAAGRARGLRRITWALSLGALSLAPPGLGADGQWRIEAGELRISVPLKPGGAFDATSSAVSGELRASGSRPVLLQGEITLDLTKVDTGIALRNQHLRENYLEVAKGKGFDKAVLSEIRVSEAADDGFRGRSAFLATLLLHGVTGPVSGSCEIRSAPPGVTVEASFSLELRSFGIEPPQYMGVGVGNKLLVRVSLSAASARGGTR